jgi:prepilin-type N-terminal cleavage/methylation domain-containing protein
VTPRPAIPARPAAAPAAGFTLLELVVVLAILGILTLLASQNIATRQHDLRARESDRILAALGTAVLGDPWSDDAPPSFAGDLGRLPRALPATNAAGERVLALSELAVRPADVPPYALRPATDANRSPASAPHRPMDDDVRVPCGWRGPYLPLPPASPASASSAGLFRDAWGNPFTSATTNAPAVPANRLLPAASADGSASTAIDPGAPVAAIRHLGSDGVPGERPGAPATRDRILPLDPAASLAGDLFWPENDEADPALSAVVRLYGPEPVPGEDSPPVRIWETTLSRNGAFAHWTLDDPAIAAGPRVLRIALLTASGAERPSIPFPIRLRPGPNTLSLDCRDAAHLDIKRSF